MHGPLLILAITLVAVLVGMLGSLFLHGVRRQVRRSVTLLTMCLAFGSVLFLTGIPFAALLASPGGMLLLLTAGVLFVSTTSLVAR
jgi:hypothetical protein